MTESFVLARHTVRAGEEDAVSAEAFEAHRETPHFLGVMQQQIAPRLETRSFERFD